MKKLPIIVTSDRSSYQILIQHNRLKSSSAFVLPLKSTRATMSAELGLAIAGVAATGAALSKALFGIYHSVRHTYRDVRDIATQLDLLRSVLKELQRALRKSKTICSADADQTIRGLLAKCTNIFDGIEDLTAPLRSADGDLLLNPPLGRRLKFYFKKDDLRLLQAQLESLKSTIHLMVSIIQVGRELPSLSSRDSSRERTPPRLKAALCVASELVDGERNCLADLLLIEEQVYAGDTEGVKFTRISAWLSGIVGLNEQGSSDASIRSVWTLSAAQRSITGSASNDVEMLLDKWTTVSDTKSEDARSQEVQGSDESELDSISSLSSEDDQNFTPTLNKRQVGDTQQGCLGIKSASKHPLSENLDLGMEAPAGRDPNSISTIEEPRYFATVTPCSSESGSSGTITPVAESLSPAEPVQSSPYPGFDILLPPILVNRGDDGDNETIHDLRRVSLADRRVRINIPDPTDGFPENRAKVQDWLTSSVESEDEEDQLSTKDLGTTNLPYQYHTPFSQISILSSQAPSEASSISTIRDNDSSSRKVYKIVKSGKNLVKLKKYSGAASLFKDAYDIAKSSEEVDDAQMMEIKFQIGIVFGELGKYRSAGRVLRNLLEIQRQQLGEDMKNTQLTRHYLGRIYSRQEQWRQAYDLYQVLWALRQSLLLRPSTAAADVDLALRTGHEYGQVLLKLGLYEEAARVLGLTYSKSKNIRGAEDTKITLEAGTRMGRALRSLGKVRESSDILSSIYDTCILSLESDHPITILCAHELALALCEQGRFRESEPLARSVWENKSKSQKFTISTQYDDETLDCIECLAKALRGLDKNAEARDMFRTVQRGFSRRFGQHHPRTIRVIDQLSEILLELEEEYEAERHLKSALVASRPITNDTITEDLTHIAEKLGPLLLNQDRKVDALEVYGFIFLGEKKFLGIDSILTLSNGHKYGSLCFDLHKLPTAETVFVEVWDRRKQVLGEKDPESIASGFQLGQVYFMRNNYEAAVSTHQSILNLRVDLFGAVSAEVIESSEVLGIVFVSNTKSFEQGFRLLRDALESKKQLYGAASTTISSAFRLASLSAGHGKFPDASELFSWIFEASKAKESAKSKATALASGFTAAGFQYIQQKHVEGNRTVGNVVQLIAEHSGETSRTAQIFAHGHAMILLLQRDGQGCRQILRHQFALQRRNFGPGHQKSVLVGEFLAISTLVDTLLKKTNVSNEVDKVNDWLFAQKQGWTIVMRFAMAASLICACIKLDELAQALLSWLHRTQKRLFGRFDRETLITLAIHHAFHLRRRYKRAKKIPSRDHSALDPRVLIPKIWPTLTKSIGHVLAKATTGEQRSKVFTTWLPKLMTEWTLYEGYRRERLTRLFIPEFVPQMQNFFTPEFAEHVQGFSRSREAEDDVASRVWTIASSELRENDDGTDDEGGSVDFSGVLDERATERLRSLGDSLIDLTMGAEESGDELKDSGEERAESRLKSLQSELVSEVISEASIDAAKENYEAFEQETDDI